MGTVNIFRNLLLVAMLGVIVSFGLTASQDKKVAAQAVSRPNIVFILTDDLDAKSLGSMPMLQEHLIRKGTKFTNAFVTDSLCCPSRATILRGQYSHNHQIWTNELPDGGFEKFRDMGHESSTVATWLQSTGYRTVLIGKYFNAYSNTTHVPPGWNGWHSWVGATKWNINGKIVEDTRRRDDIVADKAVRFIENQAGSTQPFFMYLAPHAPHTGSIQQSMPDPRYNGKFDGVSLPKPPSFNEQDVSDKPAWVKSKSTLTSEQINSMQNAYRDRLESLLTVDAMIGRINSSLKAAGKLDNTYIVFTSDNGFHMGEHRLLSGKWTGYEEDIRVPLIVRGPRVPWGRTLDHMVLNIDFAPTFAALGQAQTPFFVDGRPIKELLTASAPPLSNWRSAFLVESKSSGDDMGRPTFEALRSASHFYAEYATGERELYDLANDPYQLTNRYSSADSDLKNSLASRLAAFKSCAGTTCRAAENGP